MPKKTILIIGFVWPEPNATAAGGRMLQLIHYFLNADTSLTFASAAVKSKLSLDLKSLGVSSVPIRLNDAGFDEFIKDLNPDIVIFDRFLIEEQFGWRVAEYAPEAIRILDSEDLHSLRKTREKYFDKGEDFSIEKWKQASITKREIASIFRCDLSFIVSTYEMQLLSKVIKIDSALLLYLPFLLDKIDKKLIETWPTYNSRQHFICVGNGKHAPNIDAIIWLKQEIWPLIRKTLPHCELTVYGAYLPEHINKLNNPKEGFLVKGWAENIKEVLENAKINLAPLRFGAGIKGKLTDAMQCGTPSISTTIGIEGMFDIRNVDWAVFDTAAEFASAAIALYGDKASWSNAQQLGIRIINNQFNKAILGKNLQERIAAIEQNLGDHRSVNFIGSMLMHQSLQSTKYMSKWIEAKN